MTFRNTDTARKVDAMFKWYMENMDRDLQYAPIMWANAVLVDDKNDEYYLHIDTDNLPVAKLAVRQYPCDMKHCDCVVVEINRKNLRQAFHQITDYSEFESDLHAFQTEYPGTTMEQWFREGVDQEYGQTHSMKSMDYFVHLLFKAATK